METGKRRKEDMALEVILALRSIGEIAIEQNLINATIYVMDSLDRIGKATTEQHIEDITLEVAKTRNEIAEALSNLEQK